MAGRSLRTAVRAIAWSIVCILTLWFPSASAAQTPQLIVDLLTTPQKFWNTTVVVKGHVKTVAPNPPGTNRGTFVFRDSSDSDITVVTDELPSIGKEYTIVALVEQEKPDVTVPVLRERSRRVGIVVGAAPASTESAPTPKPMPAAPAPAPVVTTAPAAPATPPTAAPAVTPAPAPAAVDSPSFLGLSSAMTYGLIVAVALLSLGLILMFRPKSAPTQELEPRVIVHAQRVPAQIAGPAPAPPSMDPADQATKFVTPKPVATAAATTVFIDLGADLVISEGPDTGKKFPLTKPRVTIGRRGARQNEVELSDQSVSREHAKIVYNPTDQTFNLINESVTNPTRVNGTAIESALLQPNDLIQLGATTITFVRKHAGPSA